MFYWAKIGEFELFVKAVYNYKISQLNRKKVTYNSAEARRNTVAKYHFAMQDEQDHVDTDNSDMEIYGPMQKD